MHLENLGEKKHITHRFSVFYTKQKINLTWPYLYYLPVEKKYIHNRKIKYDQNFTQKQKKTNLT